MAWSGDSADLEGSEGAMGGVDRLVGEILRNAVGQIVKGGSLSERMQRVVADAVETVDRRGPEVVRGAGIMTWRYAVLGWATWNVGKFVARRRRRQTQETDRSKPNMASRGGCPNAVSSQPDHEGTTVDDPQQRTTSQRGNDELDEHQVRRRAWEISQRPDAGSSEENWRRAEEELRQEEHRARGTA